MSSAGSAKWNSTDICKFLDIFSNYEELYNISHRDNLKTVIKNTKFNQLLKEMKDSGK